MSNLYKDQLIKKILFTLYDKHNQNPTVLNHAYYSGVYEKKTIDELQNELKYLSKLRS